MIKVVYPDLQNAGDLLNIDLIEKLSGEKVVRSKIYDADMLAIGGALIGTQYSDAVMRRFSQAMLGAIYAKKPLYVWGSGFWHDKNPNELYRKNLKVLALRGEKTRQKLSGLTGKKYDVPLADAGILADIMLDKIPEKKYEIGLIPHIHQQNEDFVKKMAMQENVHFIDIKQSPIDAIREIAECKYIVSSSLHGLIFADSLHIPSLHLIGKTPLRGGNFKFEDYYSCYGLEDKPWVMDEKIPTVEDIVSQYEIDWNVVDEKKKELLECFPKF